MGCGTSSNGGASVPAVAGTKSSGDMDGNDIDFTE